MSTHRSIPQEFELWYADVGRFSREIVAKRVTLLAVAGGIVSALATAGIIPTGVDGQVTGWLGTGVTVVAAIVGALWARKGVTPADPALKPTASTGEPLLTVKAAEAAVAVGRTASPVADPAAAALAAANLIHPA